MHRKITYIKTSDLRVIISSGIITSVLPDHTLLHQTELDHTGQIAHRPITQRQITHHQITQRQITHHHPLNY